MTEIGEIMVQLKPVTDELEKRGFEYKLAVRRGEQYLELKSGGFKERRRRDE
jgi:hypothetical protein